MTTTARGGAMVHAILTDWPATDEERRTSEDLMRNAVDFAALPDADSRHIRVL